MKITIDDKVVREEIEVVIKGSKDDSRVKSIYQTLLYYEKTIVGKLNDRYFQIPLKDVYYFDTVDNLIFAYTMNQVYEVNYRLYQLEELLEHDPFLRVNKHTIVNLRKIKIFHSTIHGRMEAYLKNDERIQISRHYVPKLKDKLGGIK